MTEIKLGKNGDYWQAVWYDSKNKRKRKNIGRVGKLTKTQAKAKIVRMQKKFAITPAIADAGKAPTLKAWEERYFSIRTDLAESTRKIQKIVFKQLMDEFGEDTRMDRVSADAAMEWVANIEGSENWRRNVAAKCKTFWVWAIKAKRVFDSPFEAVSTSPVEIEADWYFVTDQDMERMLGACTTDRWRCYIALCRWAGLRSEEARTVTWRDVDWDAHTIMVAPKDGKVTTKKRRRVVPVVPKLYEMLLSCFERSDGSARIVDLGDNNHNRDMKALIKRAGVKSYNKPFHTLRKNCESEWLERYPTMDVCQWMGHAPAVAMKHYKKSTAQLMQQVTEQVDSREAEAMELARLMLEFDNETMQEAKEFIHRLAEIIEEKKAGS
ncbi:site-specific integrase [Planctomycetota bacterium]|nr:site-specific integrase [Planctomycetota bacterium]